MGTRMPNFHQVLHWARFFNLFDSALKQIYKSSLIPAQRQKDEEFNKYLKAI